MAIRTRTFEELKARPPLTEAELAENRAPMAALLETARRIREEYLARGGHIMSEEEWQAEWDSRWDDDDDDSFDESSETVRLS